MSSKLKPLISLFISSWIIYFRHFVYKNLDDLVNISPLLIVYCFLDLNNNRDIVIHHISTILLNITLFFCVFRQELLDLDSKVNTSNIVCAFFDVETSTIFLSLLHLGFKSFYMKLSFLMTFLYYRIFYLNSTLYYNFQPRLINNICQIDNACYFSWYVGSIPIVILNHYWAYLIMVKTYHILAPSSNENKIR